MHTGLCDYVEFVPYTLNAGLDSVLGAIALNIRVGIAHKGVNLWQTLVCIQILIPVCSPCDAESLLLVTGA